jgi:hypothetical protein
MLNIINPFDKEFAQAVSKGFIADMRIRETARSDMYRRAREYYDGNHHTQLTDRMREYLSVDSDADFTVNYMPTVVNAKSDRLRVNNFAVENDDILQDALWTWWRSNRMDRKSGIIHLASIRDGDSFVLVEWDNVEKTPRYHPEPAFSGEGVMVYYSDERRDEIEFASKSWLIRHGHSAGKSRRLNLYFSDRIEKYISHDDVVNGQFRAFVDEQDKNGELLQGHVGEAWVVWWTDTGKKDGSPLGVPVVHFKHNDTGDSFGTSHLASVMPIQDAVNKAMIDLLGAMDTDAFDILVGYGSSEWKNQKVGPGAIVAVSAKQTEAKLERVNGGTSSSALLQVYSALVIEVARISGTPMSYFQSSGQIAAEGTMKQQEIALVSQVKKSQIDFGNAYEEMMKLSVRLHNAFSDEARLDDRALIETLWDEAESRNEKVQAETLAIKVGKLGVSAAQAQIELGYDATQLASFRRTQLNNVAIGIRQQSGEANQVEAETLTQTEGEEANDET